MIKIKRKKILKIIACALAVMAVTCSFLVVLSVLVYPKNNQKAFGIKDEAAKGIQGERENSIDVLFIGDSESYSSFSPLQMWGEHGFTSYVTSTSRQRLPYSKSLLQMATAKQKPRVVVIETNSLYAPFSADEAIMQALQDKIPVLEYHDRWKNLSKADYSFNISATHSDDVKGFLIDKSVRAADATGYMKPTDQVNGLPLANEVYLNSIISYCRSIGAEPILVSVPSTVNWNMARHNGIQAYADKVGVRYLDLNTGPTKIDINWETETRDGGDHLNLAGATKVSDYIGKYLAGPFDLPDHRNDSAYASWNDSFERYKQLVQ